MHDALDRVLPTEMSKLMNGTTAVSTGREIGAYNWTPKTIGILRGVMRMVECSAIGSGFESVRETTTGWHWTHRDTRDAVRPLCVLLVETVPMHGGTFGRPTDGIVYSNFDGVSPVGFDQGL